MSVVTPMRTQTPARLSATPSVGSPHRPHGNVPLEVPRHHPATEAKMTLQSIFLLRRPKHLVLVGQAHAGTTSGSIMEIGEAIKNPAYRIFQTEYSGCLDISAHA